MVHQIENENLDGSLSTRLKYNQVSYSGYLRQVNKGFGREFKIYKYSCMIENVETDFCNSKLSN